MRFLPVFLDVAAGTVALAGAGPAAFNKLRLLLSAGAKVRGFSNNADVAEEALLVGAHSNVWQLASAAAKEIAA